MGKKVEDAAGGAEKVVVAIDGLDVRVWIVVAREQGWAVRASALCSHVFR
jgi:hypothetical protein